MKKKLLIFLTFISLNVLAQSTPFEIVEEMGRGINLGNVLSAPIEGNWAFSVYEAVSYTHLTLPTKRIV